MREAINFRLKKKKNHPEPYPKRMSLTVKSQTHNVPFKRLLTY